MVRSAGALAAHRILEMTVGSGGPCVKATSRSSTATHREKKIPPSA
jgi:hypothetical protein